MFRLYRLFAHFVIAGSSSLAACTVWAAARQPDLLALPWLQIGLAGVISLWGGIGRTAVRALEAAQMAKALPPVDTGFHLLNELRTDVFLSGGLGLLIYVAGTRYFQWDEWVLASALWLGGYMGTNLINAIAEHALNVFKHWSSKS